MDDEPVMFVHFTIRSLFMKRLFPGLLFLLLNASAILYGEEPGTPDRTPFTFDLEFDWIGLGVNVGYRGFSLLPSLDTIFRVILLGCYDRPGFFRTPTGEPYDGNLPGFDPASSPYAGRLILRGALEADQGLLWNPRDQTNLLECFLSYKTRFEQSFDDPAVNELLFASACADRERIFQNSIMLGLEWKDVNRRHPHRVLSGTQAEVSLEWGPRFLFNAPAGNADFLRLNLTARAFFPLFDLDPGNALNVFSAYAGFFAAVDWATGGSIPLNVRGHFGGRTPRKGLGFAVRGLEDGRLDAPFKAVANAEVRFSLPALIAPSIIPGFLVFADAGYFDLVDVPGSGFVFSAGAGLTLSLFDALNLCFTTQFLLNRTKVTGDVWTPVYFEFIWHF